MLGSSGAMGSYFTTYFLRRGDLVTGSDIVRSKDFSKGFKFAKSNILAVRDAHLVLVAVPIGETARVVREVSRSLVSGCILVEIASVKTGVLPRITKAVARKDVSLLSLHPLFGPRLRFKRMKMCVVGDKNDVRTASKLFPEANLIPLSLLAHDRLMAFALSLVHLMNIAFVSSIEKGVGKRRFEKIAPPTASLQLKIAKAILSQDASLYSSIQIENVFVEQVLSSMIRELGELREMVLRKDRKHFEKRFSELGGAFRKHEKEEALRTIYEATGS